MKKIVAMLLTLCMMVTAFAGCGSSAASTSAGSTAASGEAAATEFKWNGQKEVWSILPTTGAEGLVMINDAMGAVMEA